LLSIVITASFNLFTTLPFLHQMGLSFLLSVLVIAVISYVDGKGKDDAKGIEMTKGLFDTTPTFNISAFAISIILVALYALLW
jgi:solute:Na+ symporter, SSS family